MKYNFLIFSLLILLGCKAEVKHMNTDEISPSKNPEKTVVDTITIPSYIDTNFVMGKFEPGDHPEFSSIDKKYADHKGFYMHTKAYKAFKEMWQAAKNDGINLIIISAARNFRYQKFIWNRKWTGEVLLEGKTNAQSYYKTNYDRAIAIMRFSSMPGTSRHHWGTDIDFNAFNNSYFESGEGLKVYDWLSLNAEQYGFVQVYTNKSDSGRTGYEEEKWHWSYKPISTFCQHVINKQLNNISITGFDGSDVAERIDVKKNYIFGIDKNCY